MDNNDSVKNFRFVEQPAIENLRAIAAGFAYQNERKENPAKWTHDRLMEYIKDFEKDLDENHEIGVRLVSFGGVTTFHILDIGYYGPDIISFYGFDSNNQAVQLIQNISQLSVLLVAVEKRGDKPVRIGFVPEEPIEKP